MAAQKPPAPARWIAAGAAVAVLVVGIGGSAVMFFGSNASHESVDSTIPTATVQPTPLPSREDISWANVRRQMVNQQLRSRDITDPRVLEAMGRVPRQRFVPPELQSQAYGDYPLPIGLGQTISQPYVVALMTQMARPTAESRALEVGVGSGYQAAILAELCKDVYGIEILQPLADSARSRLAELGCQNVVVRCGDGYRGWPEHAPFDVILVTAAPERVPQPLLEQLAVGGRMVIPVGFGLQDLLVIEKRPDGSLRRRSVAPVQFVPMTGEAQRAEQ